MTTIALCDKYLASDGRCTVGDSVISDEVIKIFVTTSANKVPCLFATAGSLLDIGKMYSFLEGLNLSKINHRAGASWVYLPVDMDVELQAIVVTHEGDIYYTCKFSKVMIKITNVVIPTLGSGSDLAQAALDLGKDAINATVYASSVDVFSGGDIRYVDLEEFFRTSAKDVDESLINLVV